MTPGGRNHAAAADAEHGGLVVATGIARKASVVPGRRRRRTYVFGPGPARGQVGGGLERQPLITFWSGRRERAVRSQVSTSCRIAALREHSPVERAVFAEEKPLAETGLRNACIESQLHGPGNIRRSRAGSFAEVAKLPVRVA